ncbi:MAG: glycosyltransferase family 4 protein [Bacteroidetes bacterium]|nr:glycosyltransferase family 4 protein [Bacteroidota bacterium]
MIYVSVTFYSSMEFDSPEAWIRRTESYAGILQCLGRENKVINLKRINYTGDVVYKNIDYRFHNIGRRDALFPLKLARYIKKLQPDVVLVQGLHVPAQTIVLRMILGKKVKIIAQNHAEKPSAGVKKWLQRMADKCIDAYLFASHELGAAWVQNGNISASEKIHEVMEISSVFSPMDKAEARSKTGVTGAPVYLWVGRLNENKDPLTAVKAFLRFAASKPLARLYMIYHTDELLEPMQTIINLSPHKDAIKLIGELPHDELQYWFSSADFILSASHYEGSGTAVCEAMSCGCVPIVTDISSFRMITDNGRCGLLYEPGNESALLNALKLSCEIRFEEKQKATLKYFKSNLSFEAITERIHYIAETL